MAKPTITAVIVIYNKNVADSSTCRRIKEKGDIDILIVDNSTVSNTNKKYCSENDIRYLSMEGNKGLSKAYNVALDCLNESDVIIILDDDTEVSDAYFTELKKCLIKHPDVDIFAPIIKGQDGKIYSPNNYCFLKNKLVSNPMKEVRQSSFNAISSCLAIRMRVFNNYRYNEKLFVDEIDHCFFRDQRERKRKFGIINVVITQNFHQRENKLDPDKAWKRIKIRIIDIFRHARIIGQKEYVLIAFVKCCGLGIQMGKKTCSPILTLKVICLIIELLFIEK